VAKAVGVAMADGFLGRWSQRKLDAKEGRPLAPEPPAPSTAAPAPVDPSALAATSTDAPLSSPAAAPTEPPPTLADVQALTPESDFSRFTAPQVAPEVRNAAMKKLFADPHFNVMDGLDIYIDDYGKPDPMPASMLRSLASADFLGLFREDPSARPKENPEGSATPLGDPSAQGDVQTVAQSGPPESEPTAPHSTNDPAERAPDADPDLRLQQDPAPGPQGPGPGAQ
jgi:hypothetical protein